MNTGAFGEGFPYSNFHDLNMDWIIKIAKDFLDQYTNIQNVISSGETSLQELTTSGLEQLENKADELETLLNEWYETHSSDIANELADALGDIQTALNSAIFDFNASAYNKAQETLESIPDDYTALSNAVNKLKTAVNVQGAIIDITPEYNTNEEYFITNEGEIRSQHNYFYTDSVEIHVGEVVRVKSGTFPSWGAMLSEWTSNGSFIKPLISGSGEFIYIPYKTEYVRYSAYVVDPHYFEIYKLNDFAFDYFTIKDTKKNLKDIAVITNIYHDYKIIDGTWISSSNGEERTNPSYMTSDFIPVNKDEKLEYSFYLEIASNTAVALLALYDSNKDFISYIERSSVNKTEYKGTYTIPSNGYVRFTNWTNTDYKFNIASNNTGIFKSGMEFINEYNNTLLDGNYVQHYAYSMDNILCIGDSLTHGACYAYGFGGEAIKENYPYYMQRMLNTEAEDAGYSGITTKNWYNNHSTDYDYTDYNIAFIWLGTNGGLTDTLDTDVNPYNDYNDYADTNTGCYCKIIEKMKEDNPNIIIVLMNLFTDSLGGESNITINKIATKYGLTVIPMNDLTVADYPELHGNITNIHFTKVGNMFIARRIITYMNSVWEQNPSSCDYGIHLQ